MSDDLRTAADRLYAAAPAEFVGERTRLVREARAAGDRDLAARIGALAKPSAAAALVNDLVRRGGEDLDALLALGADLRAAQERADRGGLQRLTAARRRLLPAIVERAADRATKRPGAAVLEELQQTLQAALGSEQAADAVRSGRLLHGLSADALADLDLARAVAVPGGLAPRKARAEPQSDDEGKAERERAARERADAARREADEAEERAVAAASAVDEAEAAVADRRAELDEAQQRLEATERELARVRHDADATRTAAEEARAAAAAAAAALG